MVNPKIEIRGLRELDMKLMAIVSDDMRPSIIRGIARGPALKAAQEARRLQPVGDTGQMARTIGILRVKNPRQTWVEVGYRGRSKGHIFTTPNKKLLVVRHTKKKDKWSIKTFMWLFDRAGKNVTNISKRDMKMDVTRLFARAAKRRGLGR